MNPYKIDLGAQLPPDTDYPEIPLDGNFSFACQGCGDCCRKRNDIVLSGYDLYRLCVRFALPPQMVIRAFCHCYTGSATHLPVVRLRPRQDNGNCPFLTTASSCAIHSHKPLVCALYPLGQSIDFEAGADPSNPEVRRRCIHYFAQDTGCSGRQVTLTLREYLDSFSILSREELDLRWARDCIALSSRVKALEKRLRPIEMKYLQRKIQRALYLEYDFRQDFMPQYDRNIGQLEETLCKLEGDQSVRKGNQP